MHEDFLVLLRLLEAAALGAVIGLERELRGKAAGLRTNILICLGASLLTEISSALPELLGGGDPGRIAAQIITGVGFLGAGAIIHSQHAVHGLTSAATIWVVMAVGVTIGAGFPLHAALATVLIVMALVVLHRLERRLLGQQIVTLTMSFTGEAPDPQELLAQAGVRRRVLRSAWELSPEKPGRLILTWRGTVADAKQLAAASARLGGLTVERWMVEE
jgi:putative Mg2+ transporter-C (MgtC) family protein